MKLLWLILMLEDEKRKSEVYQVPKIETYLPNQIDR